MTLFFLDHPTICGIFNIGSGKARNWNDLAKTIFKAMGSDPKIEYMPMPENIRNQYQYHTCAETQKLLEAGYNMQINSLEEGIIDYVKNYLIPTKRLGN